MPDVAFARRRSLASKRSSNLIDSGVVMRYIVAQVIRTISPSSQGTSQDHPEVGAEVRGLAMCALNERVMAIRIIAVNAANHTDRGSRIWSRPLWA